MNKEKFIVDAEGEQKITNELRDILAEKFKKTNEDFMENYRKKITFIKLLRDTYSVEELIKHKLYQILSGSTPRLDESPLFDLPDGEIEHFIREEL